MSGAGAGIVARQARVELVQKCKLSVAIQDRHLSHKSKSTIGIELRSKDAPQLLQRILCLRPMIQDLPSVFSKQPGSGLLGIEPRRGQDLHLGTV